MKYLYTLKYILGPSLDYIKVHNKYDSKHFSCYTRALWVSLQEWYSWFT